MKTVEPVRTKRSINVWVSPAIYEALQAFLDAQRIRPTTTNVVEVALTEFLKREGLWPPKE